MILNNIFMYRESRKVITFLSSVCDQHHVTNLVTPRQVMICDMLMIRYYAAPVIQVIKTHMNKVKKYESKHGDIEYWMPMILNMLKDGTSAIRSNAVIPDWNINDNDDTWMSYGAIIGSYLIIDYGYDDMIIIQRVANTYTPYDINMAINIGKQNKVYDIRYINVVLQKEYAKKQLEVNRIDTLGKTIESSNILLHEDVIDHNILDMAQVEYNWKKIHDNAEIEKLFNEKFGGHS